MDLNVVSAIGGPEIEILGALDLVPTEAGLRPERLPSRARSQVPLAFMAAMVACPAGVRLRFQTTASSISLRLIARPLGLEGAFDSLPAAVDLVVDGEVRESRPVGSGTALIGDAGATLSLVGGEVEEARFDDLGTHDKVVDVWLPHSAVVDLVDLRTDAPVRPADALRPTWLHYGSSISHCLEATRPTATWPAVAARRLDRELVDLGFAGSALLDPFVARAIRDIGADLITLKIGINFINGDVARMRIFEPLVHGFLDTIRDGHPDVPIVVISPILCPVVETVPGPTILDPETGVITTPASEPYAEGALTLTGIRAALERIVAERSVTDPALRYLDGRRLFDAEDVADGLLPDGLHPDERGYARMGERFAELLPGLVDEHSR
jgi:hypothetical protein